MVLPHRNTLRSIFRKIPKPVYGAIVVYTNKKDTSHGHVAFLYGTTAKGTPVVLGGNQGNTINFMEKGNVSGYYLPKDYADNPNDELTDSEKKYSGKTLNSNKLKASKIDENNNSIL